MGSLVSYRSICDQVAECAQRAGRDPGSVRVVAVSKTVGEDEVREALLQGARDFGENRPELLAQKASAFPEVTWHMIGNIQSRKIPQIVEHASLIHSVCAMRHVERIDRAAAEIGKVQDVLVEVNVSGEESKSGIAPDEVEAFAIEALGFEHVRLCGLMTMAPLGRPEDATATFQGLADAHRRVQAAIRAQAGEQRAAAFRELSMGMTDDWQQAVACGATIVRIGRAIFPPVG